MTCSWEPQPSKHSRRPRPVLRHDGVEYPSVSAAAKEMELHPATIIACCKGRSPTTGGYVWEYIETPED